MSINQRLMTADELMAMPDDGLQHELVRGELRTMPPGGWEHGYESIKVAASLAPHVIRGKLGESPAQMPDSGSLKIPTRCGCPTARSSAATDCRPARLLRGRAGSGG
jgi:hypothetical protein